jgi:hypothetical protein
LPSFSFANSSSDNGGSHNGITTSGISDSVSGNSWSIGSIWSVFSKQSTASTTSNSSNPSTIDSQSRYRPAQIGVFPTSTNSSQYSNSFSNSFQSSNDRTWKVDSNPWKSSQKEPTTGNFNSYSTGNSNSFSTGNNTSNGSGLFPTTESRIAPKSPKKIEPATPVELSSIFSRYYKNESDTVEAICRPGSGIASARPSQQQITEFLNFARTAELGPIVFILMQNLVSSDWQRKSRALLVIHELIENDFPLVREYFNEEGKDTLNALADDPQIRNLILQIFSDLKKPKKTLIEPYDNYITPKQPDQNVETEGEGSLFASLEITEPSTTNNTLDNVSQNSQFDFINDEDATPSYIPSSSSLDIDPFSSPSPPPQEIPKPSQEPAKSQLPASVFSALSTLPDAKPAQLPSQNENLFVSRPTGSNLFVDLVPNKSSPASTTTFQVETRPPTTSSTSLFTNPTPTPSIPAVPSAYPPPIYPYPYPYYYPPNYPYPQMPYPPTYPYPQVPPTHSSEGAQNPQNLFK